MISILANITDGISAFMGFNVYTWVVLPFLIFLARMADVMLGTIRVVFISRGMKYASAVVGFFEVLIFILALGQIMQNLTNPFCYIGYAGGFAMGNYVGIYIVEMLSLGSVIIRVVTRENVYKLLRALRKVNFGVTSVEGHGAKGRVDIIFTVIPRREIKKFMRIVNKHSPHAFFSIEEVGFVEKGIFPLRKKITSRDVMRAFRGYRKRK